MCIRVFLLFFACPAFGQSPDIDSLRTYFSRQLQFHPQEKIYLHTDKPYYSVGETIWFRAHLADAAHHLPSTVSRYVYAELFNPLDSLVARVKVRPQEQAYSGHITIPGDLPAGAYTLRAYTQFMRDPGEEYFHSRTVRLGNPSLLLFSPEVQFEAFPGGDTEVSVSFPGVDPPDKVRIRVNEGKFKALKQGGDGRWKVRFTLPPGERRRVMLVEARRGMLHCRQYVQIPASDGDFDVSFFPEGGHLLPGVPQKIAFKALRSDGASLSVSGTVYEDTGREVAVFKDMHRGMGMFTFVPLSGKSYHAVCTVDDMPPGRFDLPRMRGDALCLSAQWLRGRLYVSVLSPEGIPPADTLYLLAHTRGILHYAALWDASTTVISFPAGEVPDGVMHLLLVDARKNIRSERLVFVDNGNRAETTYRTDRNTYSARTLVRNEISLSDKSGQPLHGSFSVSVTDASEVIADSSRNILSGLLLTSDLRGHIEDPAYYFRGRSESRTAELDALMMTQGWRRYDMTEVMGGRIHIPSSFLEAGSEISGAVKTLSGRPVAGATVNIFATSGNYFDAAVTDMYGRFYFRGFELPDSTVYWLRTMTGKSKSRQLLALLPDSEDYPAYTGKTVIETVPDRTTFHRYVEKTEQKLGVEGYIPIKEVVIMARRKPRSKNITDVYVEYDLSAEQIKKSDVTYTVDLFKNSMIPGLDVTTSIIPVEDEILGTVSHKDIVTHFGQPVSVFVDDLSFEFGVPEIDMIIPEEIEHIELVINIIGAKSIYIYTKKGIHHKGKRTPGSIKEISPLGYQSPAEFYAPKYDTSETKKKEMPDLRTTIYWNPDIRTGRDGKAIFDFHTADAETEYTVIIEGIASNGIIIHHQDKVVRREND